MRMIAAKNLRAGDVIFGPSVEHKGRRAGQSTIREFEVLNGGDVSMTLEHQGRTMLKILDYHQYVILLARGCPEGYESINEFLLGIQMLMEGIDHSLRTMTRPITEERVPDARWSDALQCARKLKHIRDLLNKLEWGDLEATNDHMLPFDDPWDESLARQRVDAGFGDR